MEERRRQELRRLLSGLAVDEEVVRQRARDERIRASRVSYRFRELAATTWMPVTQEIALELEGKGHHARVRSRAGSSLRLDIVLAAARPCRGAFEACVEGEQVAVRWAREWETPVRRMHALEELTEACWTKLVLEFLHHLSGERGESTGLKADP